MSKIAFTCYRLRFDGPAHFGAGSPEVEATDRFLRSDTLAGAITALWNQIHDGDPGRVLTGGRFLLSSAFPYAGDTLYFPRPMGLRQDLQYDVAKKLGKVRFIGKPIFESICRGEKPAWVEEKVRGAFYPAPESGPPWKDVERPRVTIDRADNSGDIFYSGGTRFRYGCGLFFLARFTDEETLARMVPFLTYPADYYVAELEINCDDYARWAAADARRIFLIQGVYTRSGGGYRHPGSRTDLNTMPGRWE
jgi:CRISPR type III-A-associated RAMP protein Csm4